MENYFKLLKNAYFLQILYFILITYLFTSHEENLDAETVFMSMNYINLIKLAVNILPMFVRDFVKVGYPCRLKRCLNYAYNTININFLSK